MEDLMPEEGGRRLELGLVQKVLRAVLSALEFLHGRGVVHRWVKLCPHCGNSNTEVCCPHHHVQCLTHSGFCVT